MKAAIYLRVSTEEQAKEGFSIRAQHERLEMFARSQDWETVDYYVDEGRSAKDTGRPELQRMLNDISECKIEVVLVYKLDRLTRSVMDLYHLLERFEKHGCMFKSATEVFDTTTPTGRLFITLVAAVAQWERENLADRVKLGMEQMVEEGRWPGGPAPFGYKLDKHSRLQINPDELSLYEYMYDLYEDFKGDNAISIILNHGLKKKTRLGNSFSAKTVRDILKNPIAYGALQWGGKVYEGFCDGIVSKERYERLMDLRSAKSKVSAKAVSSTYIFTGTLKCGRCGASLKGRMRKTTNQTTYTYLVCTNQRERKCDLPIISEQNVEKRFLNELQLLLVSQFDEANEIAASVDQENSGVNQRVAQIRKQMQAIKERKKKWQMAYADDVISLNDLREHMNQDRKRYEELENELLRVEAKPPLNHSPVQVVAILSNFLTNWNQLEPMEKKQAVMLLLERFEVNAENGKRRTHSKRVLALSNFIFR
ncbi:recombinase family protein [Shouchella patagoniensis]|uniref:recombinase family protein n=1 Tax=Shouchella patagoniensis TaxID=228576 RepID=UPI000995CD42|nr:recombinase family protein [Shouchella patagoniensis]